MGGHTGERRGREERGMTVDGAERRGREERGMTVDGAERRGGMKQNNYQPVS